MEGPGFLNHAGMSKQKGAWMQGVQQFSHRTPDLGSGKKGCWHPEKLSPPVFFQAIFRKSLQWRRYSPSQIPQAFYRNKSLSKRRLQVESKCLPAFLRGKSNCGRGGRIFPSFSFLLTQNSGRVGSKPLPEDAGLTPSAGSSGIKSFSISTVRLVFDRHLRPSKNFQSYRRKSVYFFR